MIFEWITNNQEHETWENLIYTFSILTPLLATTIFTNRKREGSKKTLGLSSRFNPYKIPIATFLAILFFIINFDPALSRFIDLYHEGETLVPGSIHIHNGSPYKDTWLQHGFIKNYLLPRTIFEILGNNFLSMRLGYAIADSIAYPIYFTLAFLVFRGNIFISILATALISGTNYWLSLRQTTYFLSIIFLLLYSIHTNKRKGGNTYILACGFFTTLSIWNSLEFGIYALIGNILSLFYIMHTKDNDPVNKNRFTDLSYFVLSFALTNLVFLFYLHQNSLIWQTFNNLFGQIKYQSGIWGLPYPSLKNITYSKSFYEIYLDQNLFFYLTPLLFTLTIIFIANLSIRKKSNTAVSTIVILLIHSILSFRTCLGRSDFGHWIDATALSWLLLFALAEIIIFSILKDKKFKISTMIFLLFIGLYTHKAFLLFDPINVIKTKSLNIANLKNKLNYNDALTKLEPQINVLDELKKEISGLTSSQDCVYDFSNQPGFYYFINRKPASRFFAPVYIATREQEEEAISDLLKCKTKVIIFRANTPFDAIDGIATKDRTPNLYQFLLDDFSFYKNIHGIELYVKKE